MMENMSATSPTQAATSLMSSHQHVSRPTLDKNLKREWRTAAG